MSYMECSECGVESLIGAKEIKSSFLYQQLQSQFTLTQAALEKAKERLRLIAGPDDFYDANGDRQKQVAAKVTLEEIDRILKGEVGC